jgi:plastocyanin
VSISRRRLVLLAAGAALAAASACSPTATQKTFHVVVKDLMFGATPPEIHVGDTLEWDNADLFLHSATAADGSFDVDLKPGAHVAMPLKKAGTFDFVCKYHPNMKGRLVVSP